MNVVSIMRLLEGVVLNSYEELEKELQDAWSNLIVLHEKLEQCQQQNQKLELEKEKALEQLKAAEQRLRESLSPGTQLKEKEIKTADIVTSQHQVNEIQVVAGM